MLIKYAKSNHNCAQMVRTRSSPAKTRPVPASKPAAAKPAAAKASGKKTRTPSEAIKDRGLLLHAAYMVTIGIFNKKSVVPPKWRPELRQPFTSYALSSWFYSAVGVMTLLQSLYCPLASTPGWPPSFSFPEAVLGILQGVWSYWSDCLAIGTVRSPPAGLAAAAPPASSRRRAPPFWPQDSIAHVVDRFSAVALTFLQFYKFLFILLPWMGALDVVWTGSVLLLGAACKMADYHAMQSANMALYRRSHFWWHVSLPFGLGSWIAYKWYAAEQCFDAPSPWWSPF